MAKPSNEGIDRVSVWQCIGCGKIEAPQPCIGVCEDHRVDMVYAWQYDAAMAQAALVRRQAQALEAFVRRFAHTTPHAGQWESSYRALQAQARQILPALGSGDEAALARATAPPKALQGPPDKA